MGFIFYNLLTIKRELIRRKPNLAINGDFKVTTVGDVPDFWDWDAIFCSKEIGSLWWEIPCVEIIEDFSCGKCLKINVTEDVVGKVEIRGQLYFYEQLRDKICIDFFNGLKLSFAAKADQASQIEVHFFDCVETFDLTTDWQEFSLVKFFKIGEGHSSHRLTSQDMIFRPKNTGAYYLSCISISSDFDIQNFEESPYVTSVVHIPPPRERSQFRSDLSTNYKIDYNNVPEPSGEPSNATVAVDPQKRCILIDGEAFFYAGACYLHAHLVKEFWESSLQEIVSNGYTAIVSTLASSWNEDRASDDDILAFMDLANLKGLKVIVWVNPNAVRVDGNYVRVDDLSVESRKNAYMDEVSRLSNVIDNHSALLGWFYDEPDQDFIESGALDELINFTREIDTEHIVMVNYGSVNRSYSHFQLLQQPIPVDCISHTCYPIPVVFCQDAPEKIAAGAFFTDWKSLTTIWLQLWSGKGRYPTPDEFTCMAYLAAIYGATGFQTWPVMPSSKLLWDRVKVVISEMKQLEDWLYRREYLSVTIDNDLIDFALKQVDSDYILVTVNFSNQAQDTIITLDDIPSISQIEDFFTGDPVSFSGNAISISYSPYERKVFKIIP